MSGNAFIKNTVYSISGAVTKVIKYMVLRFHIVLPDRYCSSSFSLLLEDLN